MLALASGQTPARAADPVKLDFTGSVTWFGQVPIMVTVDKGYFQDEGIDVTIQVRGAQARGTGSSIVRPSTRSPSARVLRMREFGVLQQHPCTSS